MAELNHTIVWCTDNKASSAFLAEMLSLPAPEPFYHFMVVTLGNGVSLDFMEHPGPIGAQHYAFLVDDPTFDAGMALIEARGQKFWSDPQRSREGEINRNDGGRGVYFLDPDGHVLEMLTTPYGVPKS